MLIKSDQDRCHFSGRNDSQMKLHRPQQSPVMFLGKQEIR